jgi:hypothetical protein
MNRSAQPQHVTTAPQTGGTGTVSSAPKKSRNDDAPSPSWMRWLQGAILILGVLLLAAIVGYLATSKPESQAKFVAKDKLQAVFLNNGQVYFGNIRAINPQYFVLGNIYYLQTQESADKNTAPNISLVKLGCELHEPFDQMMINRDQVTFWENLQDGGQVAEKIKEFKNQNPNGQKCSTQGTAPSNNTNVQGNNAGTGNNNGTNNNSGAGSTTPTTKP